jgi:rsbT co-antagonist protein RsbR
MKYNNSNYITVFEKWDDQKKFFCFTEKDAENLQKLHAIAAEFCDQVVEELYEHLLHFEDVRIFLNNDEMIRRLKESQKKYFLEMTSGDYGQDYYEKRIQIGIIHKRLGIPPRLYMGAYSYYVQIMIPKIYNHANFNQEEAQQLFLTFYKIVNLDQELAISAYVHAVENVIMQQADEILAMSTPIMQIWDGIVAAPIIGTLDSQRTQQFMEQLLQKIVESKSTIALVDITGVPQIDTATAQHLIDTINAVRLLGSKVIITGIRPVIAQTLVHLGINLKDVISKPSMGEGLKIALEMLSDKKS